MQGNTSVRVYTAKRRRGQTFKKKREGVLVKTKRTPYQKRATLLNTAISISVSLLIAAVCMLPVSISSLWYETLIKPSFLPGYTLFAAIFCAVMLMMSQFLYKAVAFKSSAVYVALAINCALLIITFYMFFIFKSLLGGFILSIILPAHSLSLIPHGVKYGKCCTASLYIYIAAQIFCSVLIYTFLMLN